MHVHDGMVLSRPWVMEYITNDFNQLHNIFKSYKLDILMQVDLLETRTPPFHQYILYKDALTYFYGNIWPCIYTINTTVIQESTMGLRTMTYDITILCKHCAAIFSSQH